MISVARASSTRRRPGPRRRAALQRLGELVAQRTRLYSGPGGSRSRAGWALLSWSRWRPSTDVTERPWPTSSCITTPTRRSPRRCASRFGIKQLAWKSVRDPQHHAQARPDAADRRLSQDAGDAGRRRHLLRHPADHAGDREARLPKPPLAAGRPGGRGAGARHVDRPQHLLVGGRRGDGRDRRPAARGLQEGPQRVLRPPVRPRAAQGRAADGARADLCPARRSPSRCCATAGRSCWAPCPAWPIARSTIRCGSCRSAWASGARRRRSTGCPRSSTGRSA